jgi:hypothetical protein
LSVAGGKRRNSSTVDRAAPAGATAAPGLLSSVLSRVISAVSAAVGAAWIAP